MKYFNNKQFNKNKKNTKLIREEIVKILKDSVNHHSITDTKIGLLVSGGVDSSLIYEIYKKQIIKHSIKKKMNLMTAAQ